MKRYSVVSCATLSLAFVYIGCNPCKSIGPVLDCIVAPLCSCGTPPPPPNGFVLDCVCTSGAQEKPCKTDNQGQSFSNFFTAEMNKCNSSCQSAGQGNAAVFTNAFCQSHSDPGCSACTTSGDPSVPLDSADGTFDHDHSATTLANVGGTSSFRVHGGGQFAFEGGECSGECPIVLTDLEWQADDAVLGDITVDVTSATGVATSNARFINANLIAGTKHADGTLSFPKENVSIDSQVTISGAIAGVPFTSPNFVTLSPPADITGSYDVATKSFSLHGRFVSSSGEADVDLVGTVRDRPPIAVAGASQTVACDPNTGQASVTLDGSASHDLDGNPFQVAWSEGSVQLATTLVANVSLSAGVHTITLTASTPTKAGQDTTTVTVADSAPPVVAPPPDLTIAACDGAAVDPGQPTIVDACESASALANATVVRTIVSVNGRAVNDPLPAGFVFEPGVTVIRYDVTDVKGGTASATQTVTVGPAAPAWVVNHAYEAGDRVTFHGRVYQCIQAHTSQSTWKPTATPALWESPTPCGVVPWASQTAYVVGSQVTFQGHQYECIEAHESQAGWNPAATPALWKLVT